jgi:acyl carrier protein
MEINKFIENFLSQLEDVDDSNPITGETCFRDIHVFDSMDALSIIVMAEDEYNVKITGADIKNSQTFNDLFEIVKSKK